MFFSNNLFVERLVASLIANQEGLHAAYANGIRKDLKTDLEWKAGPHKDMNWDDARSWVQTLNFDGGGWRMPTMDELKVLYRDRNGFRSITPLLKANGWYVWSGETKGSSDVWAFGLVLGFRYWINRNNSLNFRVLAVRSRVNG